MPIEAACPACGGKFRVPDAAAGKKVRCPKCQEPMPVPALAEPSAPAEVAAPKIAPPVAVAKTPSFVPPPAFVPPAPAAPKVVSPAPKPAPIPVAPKPIAPKSVAPPPERWTMKSEEGADYGPVTRAELDAWHAEGRVTADCQLLREGSEQWQWASDVYSDLVEEEEPAAPSLAAAEEITEEDDDEEPASVFAPRAPQKTTPQKTSLVKAGVKATPLKSVPNQASGARRGAKKVFAAPPEEDEDETDDSGEQPQLSTRSKVTAGLLGLFLGPLGIHRFYLGYAGLGLAMLFTLGGCGIWSLTDAILIFLGKVPDAEGNPLRD